MTEFKWIKDPIQDILNQVASVKCGTVGICETVSPCAVYCAVYTIIPPGEIRMDAGISNGVTPAL
jgi:hypothetical protein